MTEIPEQTFDKITVDMVTECETSTSIFLPSFIIPQDDLKPSPYQTSQWTL